MSHQLLNRGVMRRTVSRPRAGYVCCWPLPTSKLAECHAYAK